MCLKQLGYENLLFSSVNFIKSKYRISMSDGNLASGQRCAEV